MISQRETEVLQLIAQGYTDEEIAAELYLAYNTIRTHRQNIRIKLAAKNTAHAVAIAIRLGLI